MATKDVTVCERCSGPPKRVVRDGGAFELLVEPKSPLRDFFSRPDNDPSNPPNPPPCRFDSEPLKNGPCPASIDVVAGMSRRRLRYGDIS